MRVVSWVVEQPGHPMVRQERDESAGRRRGARRDGRLRRLPHRPRLLLRRRAHAPPVPAHARPRDQRHGRRGRAPAPSAWIGPRGRRARGDPVRRVRGVPRGPRADLPEADLPRQRRPRRLRHARARARARALPACPTSAIATINPAGLDLAALSVDRRRGLDAVPGHRRAAACSRRPRGLRRRGRRRRLRRADRGRARRRTSSPSTSTRTRLTHDRAARRRARRSTPAADAKALRKAVRDFADGARHPDLAHRRSSRPRARPPARRTAFGLLGHGGYLSVVGYTPRSPSSCGSRT